jgi:hypothetical protein
MEWSSGRGRGAEAPTTNAGRIRLKTRAIESRAGKSIFLFFIVTSYYPPKLFSFSKISSL